MINSQPDDVSVVAFLTMNGDRLLARRKTAQVPGLLSWVASELARTILIPLKHPNGVAGGVDAMINISTAEVSGLESVWTGEHVVLPDPRVAPSPSDLKRRFSIRRLRSAT